MTTLTPASSAHSLVLQHSLGSNTLLALCGARAQDYKSEIRLIPLITPQQSHELVQRLYEQKSRLIQLYDAAIERQQPSPQLLTFLSRIDQLLDEHACPESSSLIISNHLFTVQQDSPQHTSR